MRQLYVASDLHGNNNLVELFAMSFFLEKWGR